MPYAPGSRWEVRVAGDPRALRFACDALIDRPIHLVREDDRYILASDDWNQIAEIAEVRSRSSEFLAMLSGALTLKFEYSPCLEVAQVILRKPDGKPHYFLEIQDSVHGHTSDTVRMDPEEISPEQEFLATLEVAGAREEALKLLRLVSQPDLKWVELYRISDVVVAAGGTRLLSETAKGELNRFRHTANSVGAVGDEARHGHERTQPPGHPMTLAEARTFVLTWARDWIRAL